MMTVEDHIREIIEHYPECEVKTASAVLWRAAIQVYREHAWIFCITEGRIVCEASYGDGTVAVTNGSTAIALTGGAWDPTWTLRRIVIPGRPEPYDLTNIFGGGATLAQPWQGEDNPAASYITYRDQYSLPADCELGQAYYILDPLRNRSVKMKDFGVYTERQIRETTGPYLPTWATHVGLDAAGAAQIRIDPYPAVVEVYPLVYFATPTKPTALNQSFTPLFPAGFEDLLWLKALWLYAEMRRKWRNRDQHRASYYDRFYDAIKQFDGGAEIDRYIRGTYPAIPLYWDSQIAASAVRGAYT